MSGDDLRTASIDTEAIFWLKRIHDLVDDSKKQFQSLEVEIEAIKGGVKRDITQGFKTHRGKAALEMVRKLADDLRQRLWEYQELNGGTEALTAIRKFVDFARESIYQQQGRSSWTPGPMQPDQSVKRHDSGSESMGVYWFGHHVPIPLVKAWPFLKWALAGAVFFGSHLARSWLKGKL